MDTIRKREIKPFISDFNPMAKVQAMRERLGGETAWNGEAHYIEKAGSGDNLLKNHRFASLHDWVPKGQGQLEFFLSVLSAGHRAPGQNAVLMRSLLVQNIQKGLTQYTGRLPAGRYTFSAYIMPYTNIVGTLEVPGVYLAVMDREGKMLCESRRVKVRLDRYARLSCSFCLHTAQSVKVGIWISGMGTVFVNAPQLEQGSDAGKYNLLVNGNFENRELGWSILGGGVVPHIHKNMSSSLTLKGEEKGALAVQTVPEKLYEHERAVYTLGGWAKREPKVQDEVAPFPQLLARICYSDGSYEIHGTSFTERTEQWQFSAVQFFKSRYKDMQNIEVYCWQEGQERVYFDKLQLVRDQYETDIAPEDFA